MSLMYNKTKNVPSTDPCEAPGLVDPNEEVKPSRTSLCFLFIK